MNIVMQLVTAFCGSLGFSILFNIRKDKLLPAAFGGLLAWSTFLFTKIFVDSNLVCLFIASVSVTIYAEIFARIKKTPATLFLVPALIPLLPGGALYNSMSFVMQKKWTLFFSEGMYTLLVAVSIAGGMLITMVLLQLFKLKKIV